MYVSHSVSEIEQCCIFISGGFRGVRAAAERRSQRSFPYHQSKQWVDGSWVNALSPMTHLHIYERHFSAFNARHIITSQRNLLFPETVEALSVVLEGYKNNLLQ